jgi:hypothetical protein
VLSIAAFYAVLLVIEMYLMFPLPLGPNGKTGKYHFEQL